MRKKLLLSVVIAALGCGPVVTIEDPPPDAGADCAEEAPVEYCAQGDSGRPCVLPSGVGICFTAGVCASPCASVDDCPPPWKPCINVTCEEVGLATRICTYPTAPCQ